MQCYSNEFLKEPKRVEEQQGKIENQQVAIAEQQEELEAHAGGLRKINAELEARKPATGVVFKNQ